MAVFNRKKGYQMTSDKDASWGLIYRLNALWSRVELPAEHGDYDSWNNILDSLYRNLLYRYKLEIQTVDDPQPDGTIKKKIIKVQMNEEAVDIYNFLTKNIFKAKGDFFRASKAATQNPVKKNEALISRSRWYHAVQLKDIWLRKYMQELGLYLKEIERSPGTALFGGG